ncbi:asparaginase [Noviherbaspirillum aerium]|uniref:asparaginase n=1 Tax=Noviherbaspirillum aerium TaxID=2588497 RepID=UPI00124C79A1|nr:asparaginase [Noviherbaspirillum aerium]
MALVPFVPLVEATRGGHTESIHHGAVAVVNVRGEVLYHAGDPDFLTFTRSTIKPFQALPFLQGGGHERFGFDTRELALLCASHSGEAMHTGIVERMLHKAGCGESHLRCGCHVPIYYPTHDKAPDAGASFNQLHNNCSGKHAGFLAYCVQHGAPLDDYVNPAHPLQQAVQQSLADVAGLAPDAMPMGIDGCSAPNFALPLSRLALAYARLAQGGRDPVYGHLMGDLFDAMTLHPELVSGTGRSDLAFMQAAPGDWVAKVGAEAVQAIGIRSMGIGIAVKIADGSARALLPAAIAALRQIGAIGTSDPINNTPLASWANPHVNNFRGVPTGDLRAVFALSKH